MLLAPPKLKVALRCVLSTTVKDEACITLLLLPISVAMTSMIGFAPDEPPLCVNWKLPPLSARLCTALQSPELSAQFRQLGYEPIGDTPEQASTRIKADVALWTKIIRDAGIQPQ